MTVSVYDYDVAAGRRLVVAGQVGRVDVPAVASLWPTSSAPWPIAVEPVVRWPSVRVLIARVPRLITIFTAQVGDHLSVTLYRSVAKRPRLTLIRLVAPGTGAQGVDVDRDALLRRNVPGPVDGVVENRLRAVAAERERVFGQPTDAAVQAVLRASHAPTAVGGGKTDLHPAGVPARRGRPQTGLSNAPERRERRGLAQRRRVGRGRGAARWVRSCRARRSAPGPPAPGATADRRDRAATGSLDPHAQSVPSSLSA